MKKVCINSQLYNELFLVGGDRLIAVYCMLRFYKNRQVRYYKEEGRNIYHTLKERTKLSVTTLRKYTKELSKLNLCRFDSKGNFCLVGTNKINKLYHPNRSKAKIVIVEIGTYNETKLNSFKVRVLAMEKSQKKRIDRRDKLNKIVWRDSKGYLLSKSERSSLNNMTESDDKYNSGLYTFTAKTVLSNQGFSKLKFGESRSNMTGYYWKRKLVSKGIIKVRRRFQYLKKCSYSEYRNLKFNVDISLMYKNGRLFKELIPEFTTTDFPPKEVKYKKRTDLQFDFLDFLINQ